ncbi:M15 family metallopeptidase [Streptomyces sp. NK15101]|uniref:M15 family metallopeptidase n=1 Tax=Streptomyces sp. NK15101 TaxID=2873261 RepID=UPI0035A8C975
MARGADPPAASRYASPEESGGACSTHAEGIGAEARAHREPLGSVPTAADLVNHPTEWWHWSFGDRHRAPATGAATAPYGPKELTPVG